jgi:hypothetical protein
MTQGLYARAVPTPTGEAAGFLALFVDPNQTGVNGTGRLWGFGLTSGKIGYTDDYGSTFVPVQALPAGAAGSSPCQMVITSGVAGGDFMFVLFNSASANAGSLWRAPAPGASPASLTFTCIQANDVTNNLVNGPGGVAGHTGDGSNYRNQSFAIQPDGSAAYLVPYAAGTASVAFPTRTGQMGLGSDILFLPAGGFTGAQHGLTVSVPGAGAAGGTLTGVIQRIFSSTKAQLDVAAQTSSTGATITFSGSLTSLDIYGGPTFRYCANPCAASAASVVWTAPKNWVFARHAHAVKIVGGVPWVSLGDFPYPQDAYASAPPTTHVGLWAATDATAATWNQKMSPSAYAPYDAINFFPITVGGQPCIVMESDSKSAVGPVFLPTQSNAAGTVPPFTSLGVQLPVVTTMRCLIPTSEGNLMWYGTGEGGGVGPVDGIFIAAAPFDTPILLEQVAAGTATSPLNAVELGPYVFMGNLRIVKEKFVGQ